MSDGRDVIYLYDGSFYGLLTVVFACFYRRIMPYGIETDENVQQTVLCDYEYIQTDNEKAVRVEKSIRNKISYDALNNIFLSYLSNMPDKEINILLYIRAGYKFGKYVDNHLTLDCVNNVVNYAQKVGGEAHLITGFARFSKLKGGVYYAKITPKNNILPVIEKHFTERYSSMPFLIHDTVHDLCLVYNGKSSVIQKTDTLPKIELDKDELEYRNLWKCFFDTIEIKERHNEKCQNTHLPKHYRKNMTEFCL